MSEWHYIEKDGNPTRGGFYLVACETYISFADDLDDNGKNHIKAYGKPYRGLCFWDGVEWQEDECNSFNIDDGGACCLCKEDDIYAWADVIAEAPKMIYPSHKIEIDPAEYNLTEGQLMNFLKDYKKSFERGYTE